MAVALLALGACAGSSDSGRQHDGGAPGTSDLAMPSGVGGNGSPDLSLAPGHGSMPDLATLPVPDLSSGPAGSCSNITGTRQQQVCLHWSCDRQQLGEGTWSGNVASCSAGMVSADGITNALKLINLYRFIADLPTVTHDAALDTTAQSCALMMDANNALSHSPPMSWKCYTAAGATAAGNSNIATAPGVAAVDLYMSDSGNSTTLGHRRWILSNSLGPVGLGSTASASCLQVIGGSGNATKPWMAWPSPGPFPLGAIAPGGNDSIDITGWLLQSDDIDVSKATITVTDGGNNLAVTTSALGNNYGAQFAIRWLPKGWTTQAGHSYTVTASGTVSPAISYTVDVVACQ